MKTWYPHISLCTTIITDICSYHGICGFMQSPFNMHVSSITTILLINLVTVTSGHNSLNLRRILKMSFGILKGRAIERDQPRISPSIRLEMRASERDSHRSMVCEKMASRNAFCIVYFKLTNNSLNSL